MESPRTSLWISKTSNRCNNFMLLFNQKATGKSVKEIQEHLTEMRNKGTNVLALRLTVEQLLLHFYLLQIPGKVRGDL